jgi:two-component system sensor histidine kinase MprB
MSLRARMGLVAGMAVAVAVVAVAVSAYLGTRSAVYGQVDNSLNNLDAQILRPHNPGGEGDQDNPGAKNAGAPSGSRGSPLGALTGGGGGDCDSGLGINRPGQPFGGPRVFVQLLLPGGSICRATGETVTIPTSARARRVAVSGHGSYFENQDVNGSDIRVLVHGVPGTGALMLALPLGSADTTLDDELILMVVIAAAGIALAAVLGFLVARAAVAPITTFTRRTERIAHNVNLLERERLAVTGSDELARLARTFNETLDALEGSIEAQRNLVADASHELRTPIATLRANLQVLREEDRLPPEEREALRRDMIDELDELTNLVSDVVELARGTKASQEPGDVRLDDIISAALERARRRGPELEFSADLEPTVVHGDGERISRAVNNLLDNAIKWSPPGSTVEVGLHAGVLSVRDHGPGFDDEDLPFVFDRFHRAREARSKPGSGLGLAIVRQAAESHGGFAEAADAPGGGALIRVSFGPPIATDDPGQTLGPAALAGWRSQTEHPTGTGGSG